MPTKPWTRSKIRDRVAYWQKKMGLEFHDVGVTFKRSKRREKSDRGDFLATANCLTEPRYNMCTINFEPDRLDMVDDETIVHELLHCMCAEYHGYVQGMALNWKGTKLEKDDHLHWLNYFEEKLISILTEVYLRKT